MEKDLAPTIYIYCLEMIAVLATLMKKWADVANKSATFYIDNNNALLAILKNSAKPTSIQATAGPIWRRIRELNITPWFGRVPSKRNIADLPTRSVKIQYKSLKRDKFRMTIGLIKLIDISIDGMSKGLPTEPPSTRNRAMVIPSGKLNVRGRSNA